MEQFTERICYAAKSESDGRLRSAKDEQFSLAASLKIKLGFKYINERNFSLNSSTEGKYLHAEVCDKAELDSASERASKSNLSS